jgi:hypothetical protein
MTGPGGAAGEDEPSENDDVDPAFEETGEELGDDPADEKWEVTLEDLEDDPEPEPILPGSPAPEHVAFVLLGVALTLAVIYRLATLVGATIG